MSYFAKFSGKGGTPPAAPGLSQLGFIWLGAVIAAGVLGLLASNSGYPLVLGSFGASIFVLFVIPDAPFAQPRNVIGGHFVSSLVGLLFFHTLGGEWWSMALALATALLAMQVFKVPHPPAGSNPFIVFLAAAQWDFLWIPTFLGAVILVVVALFFNNLASDRHYPNYWF